MSLDPAFAFRDAVKKTGRKRLIVGGLHTEICLTFAVVQALKDGYDAMFVTDAVGPALRLAEAAWAPNLPQPMMAREVRTLAPCVYGRLEEQREEIVKMLYGFPLRCDSVPRQRTAAREGRAF